MYSMKSNIHSSNQNNPILFCAVILFLLSPILSGICFFIYFFSKKEISKGGYIVFLACLSMWAGGVFATKEIGGDIYAYRLFYLDAGRLGILDFTKNAWGAENYREPLYSLIVYFGYYLTGGNFRLFTFALSSATVFIGLYAAVRFLLSLRATKGAILCGVISLTFFIQYFDLVTHLTRQVLAMSIVMYAISRKAEDGKNHWWLLISSVLIHTTALLLVCFSLIPWIRKRLGLVPLSATLGIVGGAVAFNYLIGSSLAEVSQGVGAINYAAQRLGSNLSDSDSGMNSFIMALVLAPLSFFAIKNIWGNKKSPPAYCFVANIFLALTVFVVCFSQNPLVQYRYFYYTFSFIPFLLPLLRLRSSRLAPWYQFGIATFFIIYFFMRVNQVFRYAPLDDIFFYPSWYLIIHPYSWLT